MTTKPNKKTIHFALWLAQILLAAMFIMAGAMKLFQSVEALTTALPWVSSTPINLVRFIGLSELLGGLGLVLPSLLRIKPVLSIWAAYGLSTVMLLAALFHGSRGEFSAIGVNLVLIAIALFIAWGRGNKAPIIAKS